MIPHDAVHTDPKGLGQPLVRFTLRTLEGDDREVSVWPPAASPWEGTTWRGWLYVQSHPRYDPPHRICGEPTPWHAVAQAFAEVGEWVSCTWSKRITGPTETGVPPMTDQEPIYTDRAALGPPFAQFRLRDPAGVEHEVVVWAPSPTPVEAGRIFRGWLMLDGHPDYSRPRRILGEGPWQPLSLAFKIVGDFAQQRSLTRVG